MLGPIWRTVSEWPCVWSRLLPPTWGLLCLSRKQPRKGLPYVCLLNEYIQLPDLSPLNDKDFWASRTGRPGTGPKPAVCMGARTYFADCPRAGSDSICRRSPNSHVHGRHGWSLLIRLRAVCPYLGSSPARRSLIFAFLINTYSILSPARSSLTFAFLMNIYSFLIFAFLMKKTSGLRRSAFSGTGHGCSFLIRLRAVCLSRKEFPYLCLLNKYIQLPYRGRSQPYAWALGPILRTVSEWPCVWPPRLLPPNPASGLLFLSSKQARKELPYLCLLNKYIQFPYLAFLIKRTSRLRSFGLLWNGP